MRYLPSVLVSYNEKQVDLAKKLHVSQQTVVAWEVGRAVPSIDTLIAMADYFDITINDLLGKPKSISTSVDLSQMIDNAELYNKHLFLFYFPLYI